MKIFTGIVLVLMLVGQLGCGSTKEITTNSALTLTEIMQRVRERDETIQTLTGKGNITIESPESSNSASFRVSMKKPDSLLIDIRGPFGVHAATLALSRERFLFYNWMDNTALIGKPDEQTLRPVLRLAISFDQIFDVFTGEVPRNDSRDTLRQFTIGDKAYNVLYRSLNGSKEYTIDGATYVVKEYRALDDSVGSTMIASASDIEDNTLPVPQFLRIVFPHEQRSVTISYDNVRVNVPVSCTFDVPKQAGIIYR